MEQPEESEVEFEIVWRQQAPEHWQAVVTDRRSGRQWEVCSEAELRAVLNESEVSMPLSV